MRKFLLVAVALVLASTVASALEWGPVADKDVKLGRKLRGGGIVVAHGTTDSQGSITFKKLKAGAYFVRFRHADRGYEIAAKPDGEEIRISKAAAKKGSSKDSKQPDDGEKFTVKYRDVAATIEIEGNSIKATIVEP
jgi:uncharacterized surface anchored protein